MYKKREGYFNRNKRKEWKQSIKQRISPQLQKSFKSILKVQGTGNKRPHKNVPLVHKIHFT